MMSRKIIETFTEMPTSIFHRSKYPPAPDSCLTSSKDLWTANSVPITYVAEHIT